MPHIDASQFRNRFASMILNQEGFPKKDRDRHILLVSAALGLEPQHQYTEAEINAELHKWTTRFGAAVNLDHVSLRRLLVDERYLRRDSAGHSYELANTTWPYSFDQSVRSLDLEALIDEARTARELRKQQYTDKSTS